MDRIVKEDVSVGSGIIVSYQRMPQKLERVFAEFIDNSTQSFYEHKDELYKVTKQTVCKVWITWNNSEIIIEDNAYGMNHDDFKRALRLNMPKQEYSEKSRSQYGMGLKIAAAYLGDWYSIESSQLYSIEKYFSIIDIDDWKTNNPTEIDNQISDTQPSRHFTKIVIKKLQKKLTTSVEKSLRKKLALIYSKDISTGDLELYLNNIPVVSIDPELRKNIDTGSEYLCFFEDEFEFNDEMYSYSGWIGILKTASTDDAGFTLSQYGRGIKLNYRPYDIFGKSNSFQYQRVVGEIQLDDKKWKVSFNKDEFIWDDGLEKAFVGSLKSNKDVKNITTIAGNLRKDPPQVKPVIKPEDVEKNKKSINEKYEGLKKVEKTQIKTFVPDKPVVVITQEEKDKPNIIDITFESVRYSFDIQIKNDDHNMDWFNIQKKDENNSYYIIINGSTSYFADYNKKECKDMIMNLSVALALAQISSVRLGLPFDKSSIFINQLNQIIKNSN